MKRIAEEASDAKSRFLAIMSHELRNPINSILGNLDMIASEQEDTRMSDYLQALRFSGDSLKTIVNDILDLSRVEAGKMNLVIEEMSVHHVIKDCVKNFDFAKGVNNNILSYNVAKEADVKVYGDAVRVNQIMSNLVSNALKFTHDGSVSVNVDVYSETKNNIVLNFRVSDTGRGIEEENIKRIFEEYQQSDFYDQRLEKGMGLGLSIVKNLLRLMNGEIIVESQINEGTKFSIRIPFQKVLTPEQRSRDLKSKVFRDLTGTRILVVDDDKMNQIIASKILMSNNASIIFANDGLDALDKLINQEFDLVISDINMPKMNGTELIKSRDKYMVLNSLTPMVAVTGNSTPNDVKNLLNLGFSLVIGKPYSKEELLESVNFVLETNF